MTAVTIAAQCMTCTARYETEPLASAKRIKAHRANRVMWMQAHYDAFRHRSFRVVETTTADYIVQAESNQPTLNSELGTIEVRLENP